MSRASKPKPNLIDIDTAIAREVLEQKVFGTEYCFPDPECYGFDLAYDGPADPKHGGVKRPIKLDGCLCHFQEDGDYKYWGHISACLSVVLEYSLYIEQAWEIVEFITSPEDVKHPMFFKCNYKWGYKEDDWPAAYAAFDWKLTGDSHPLYEATASTMPLAICLAALEIARDEEEEEE